METKEPRLGNTSAICWKSAIIGLILWPILTGTVHAGVTVTGELTASISVSISDTTGDLTLTATGTSRTITNCDQAGRCTTDDSLSVQILVDGGAIASSGTAHGSATVVKILDAGHFSQGTHTFGARSFDNAQALGYPGPATDTTTLNIDNTPTVQISEPSGQVEGGFDIQGNVQFKPSSTGPEGNVVLFLDGGSIAGSGPVEAKDYAFSYQQLKGHLLDAGVLTQGVHTVKVRATATNGASAESATTITVDNTPTVTVMGPPDVVAALFDIKGQVSYKPSISQQDGTTVRLYLDNGIVASRATDLEGTVTVSYEEITGHKIDPKNLTIGAHTAKVETFARNGTRAVASKAFKVVRVLNLSQVSGNQQSGRINSTLPQPLVVNVTDGSGNPIPDVGVNWTITGPGGATGQAVSSTGTTDPNGNAQTSVTLGDKPGSYAITATCSQCTQGSPQTFTATATADKILSIVSGDGQQWPVGEPLPKPFIVKVTDDQDRPISGVSVTFEITQEPDGAKAASPHSEAKTTGGDGTASATLTLGDKIGDFVVQVACSECTQGSPQTFTATADQDGCTQNGASIASQVSFATGNLFYTLSLLNLTGTGPQVGFTLAYNSIDSSGGPLGSHWTHAYNMRITRDSDGFITLMEEDGQRVVFEKTTPGVYTPIDHFGRQGTDLHKSAEGYTLIHRDGTRYIFDPAGDLTQLQDRNGNALSLSYVGGNLTDLTDSSGRMTTLTYDGSNRVIGVTDPSGRLTALSYDAAGMLSQVSDPANQTMGFTYDASGKMRTRTDPNGNTVNYGYDAKGRLTSATDASGIPVTVTNNPGIHQATVTDRNGALTVYFYDPDLDVPIQIIASDGGITSNIYDSNRNLLFTTDPQGNTTGYTYDNAGDVLSITDPQNRITQYTYEPVFHQVTSVTDPEGHTTAYTYEERGNLLTLTDPTGGITHYSYDIQGGLVNLTNPLGQVTAFRYNAAGNLISATDPTGAVTTMTYDAVGNLLSRTDASGAVTYFVYDAATRLIQVTDPMGGVTQFEYDANGNRISQTDALGRTTRYEYNYLDKLIRVIDHAGGATIYNYDAKGNMILITDANGQTTRYVYDVQNRLISETDPLGNTIGYSYDLIGNLTSRTDAEGRMITYSYDALSRLLQKSYPDGTVDSFTYDANGHILTAGNSSIAYTFSYDADGRVITVTDSHGHTVGYQYDPAGNRTRLIYPDGKTVSYSYDAANRLSSLTDWANRITAFTYDNLGRRVNLALSNGTKTTYRYDPAGRLTHLTLQTRGRTVLERSTYTYNAVGKRLSVTRPDVTLNYTYDLLDRLIQATPTTMRGGDKDHDDRDKKHDDNDTEYDYSRGLGHENDRSKDHENKGERFTYDAVGNRLLGPGSKDTYVYNAGNQLIADGKLQYTFDRNGNLIQKNEIDDDWETNTWTYTYDFENRLIQVIKHEGHQTLTVAFKYDPFGRRIEKTVSERAGHRSERKITRYLYDNEDIVVDFDGSGRTLARYVHGPGIDEPLMIQKGTEAYYYHADGLGSITELTDSRHKVVESYTYSSFGVLKREGDEVKNRYTFTGREWDDDAGLYYYRERYYDSSIGRFNAVDPKFRATGSGSDTKSCGPNLPTGRNINVPLELNQYIYTIDNPINNTDSTGLSVTTIGCSASILPRIQSAAAHADAASQTCIPCEDRASFRSKIRNMVVNCTPNNISEGIFFPGIISCSASCQP